MRIPLVAIAAVSWSLLAVVPSSHAQGRGANQPAADPTNGGPDENKKNVEVVKGFWREMWLGRDGKAASKYVAEGYIEAGTGTTNGRADLVKRLGRPVPPGREQKVVSQTVYAHAPYVLLLQDREVADPAQPGKTRKVNTIEMLTVHEGVIQEHRQFWPEGQMPANQPQTKQEENNIAVAKGFLRDMWGPRDGSVAPKYLAWGYIEHGNGNENATNGRADMVRRFGHPPAAGTPVQQMAHETDYGRGPIVLVLQDRSTPDPTQPGKTRNNVSVAMFLVYDGLLQEHWLLPEQEHGVW